MVPWYYYTCTYVHVRTYVPWYVYVRKVTYCHTIGFVRVYSYQMVLLLPWYHGTIWYTCTYTCTERTYVRTYHGNNPWHLSACVSSRFRDKAHVYGTMVPGPYLVRVRVRTRVRTCVLLEYVPWYMCTYSTHTYTIPTTWYMRTMVTW
jgi:hypothetical protein